VLYSILTENVDLWLVRVICGSILIAACGHLIRDKSGRVPRVICGLILIHCVQKKNTHSHFLSYLRE